MTTKPHAFVGRADRWCEICNMPDRDPIHVHGGRGFAQLVITGLDGRYMTHAVADDGTAWQLINGSTWKQLPALPARHAPPRPNPEFRHDQ